MQVFLILLIGVFGIIFLKSTIYTIRPFQKGVVERFGKFHNIKEPGLRLIFPFIDILKKVDMREQVIDVPPQEVITKDNVGVTVDAVIYFKITDPFKVMYNIQNFQYAALKLAQTNLRNEVGNMDLDQTLTSREKINTQLRLILDEATDTWGVKVTRVEIQRIEPPQDITTAMSRQMKAERDKRAIILESEGVKQAAILKAEGEKQSQILKAEGIKQSKILVALGESEAVQTVYGAIHKGNPTKDLIAIKYLEALEKIANGSSTKVFLPLETSGILGSISGIKEIFEKDKKTEPKE
ncbi:MAG: SPFH/Band 7/PHB domain protein [bacterium]|nr:SPFH/Band 7/PHB domain protein [bacterium]